MRFRKTAIETRSTHLEDKKGTQRDGLPVRRQSPIQLVTGPGVEQLR